MKNKIKIIIKLNLPQREENRDKKMKIQKDYL